ncbi:sulfate transporter CysZ [Neptuniibacter caesariensis]|uniref:Sulfate transporter CysZ n=1 Tax=Neptuniibacter caesariensis TaxID=207954 RepID=A0A7U8C6P1_NEPCE|nr:sulfate transporter CysZ [Neptuniibacter caesariensis]EAR62522.1 cysZ protein [Oceanospirillum sp. MED92] [Neptuniibacter caesariensis]
MKGNPLRGSGYLLRGLQMLPDPEIRPFVLVPLLTNIVLFIAAIWMLFSNFGDWVQLLISTFLPDWEWLQFLEYLLWPLMALLVIVFVYYGFSIFANIIAAPFNGFLSEKVEKRLRGDVVTDEGWQAVLALIPRAIGRELSKLAYYLPRLLILLLISFIPVINFISPLLWLLFGAWMMAIQYCDYPMDNNKVSFKNMKLMLKSDRLTSIGFGGLIQVGMMIPLVNLIIMPAAVVGATIYWVEAHATIEKDLDQKYLEE